MGRFKNALGTLGDVAVALGDRQHKIDDMTNELLKRTYSGVDARAARKIATVLVDHAKVEWK
jgi:hypothetical protein